MNPAGIRYIVSDVDSAVAFYRDRLGFTVEMSAGGFALLSKNGFRLYLNSPGAGGAGQAGGHPTPGGWNRIRLEVEDLDLTIRSLRELGTRFRGERVEGRAGTQILVEDPSGNLIELFQLATP